MEWRGSRAELRRPIEITVLNQTLSCQDFLQSVAESMGNCCTDFLEARGR